MTVTTYQIAGRSPFPIITDFLAYAIERQTMTHRQNVTQLTSAEVRQRGWQAECRDDAGNLKGVANSFQTDADIIWLVEAAMAAGETVTIWPLRAAGEVRHG